MTGIQYSQLLRTRALAPRRQGCPQTTGLQLQVLRTRALAPRRQGYNTDNYCALARLPPDGRAAPRREGYNCAHSKGAMHHSIILSYYQERHAESFPVHKANRYPSYELERCTWTGAAAAGAPHVDGRCGISPRDIIRGSNDCALAWDGADSRY